MTRNAPRWEAAREGGSSAAERAAVLLLGAYDNGLSVARSLGPDGIPVYAVGCGRNLRHSRWIRWIPHSETGLTQDSWFRWLLGDSSRPLAGSVLIPCNDEAVELVAREHETLSERYRLMETNRDAVDTMLDKARTSELAERLEIPAPRVWRLDRPEELADLLPAIPFPCALKPRHSHEFHRHFGARKLFVAEDRERLVRHFEETSLLGLRMLVTEIIPGPDDLCFGYWTYVDHAGDPLFHFTKRKLRQYPAHFGIGTLHESGWYPEVAELGLRFVHGAGMRGPAVVEFKRDQRDGRLKLIECNARLVNPHELAARSGLDLSRLVYNHLTGLPLPPREDFQRARLWFPLRDFRAFRTYRSRREMSTAAWLRSLWPAPWIAQFRWSDPLPMLAPVIESLRGRFARDAEGARVWIAPRKIENKP